MVLFAPMSEGNYYPVTTSLFIRRLVRMRCEMRQAESNESSCEGPGSPAHRAHGCFRGPRLWLHKKDSTNKLCMLATLQRQRDIRDPKRKLP